jgi:hypothetical protein
MESFFMYISVGINIMFMIWRSITTCLKLSKESDLCIAERMALEIMKRNNHK